MNLSFDSNNKFPLIISTAIIATITTITIRKLLINKNKNKSKNPFEFDTREEIKQYEGDKVKRDGILKNRYTSKKLHLIGSDFDVIIIGSGYSFIFKIIFKIITL